MQIFNHYLKPLVEELIRIYRTERNAHIVSKSLRFKYDDRDILPQMVRIIDILSIKSDDKLELFYKKFIQSSSTSHSALSGFRYLLVLYQEAIWASIDTDYAKRAGKGSVHDKRSIF